MSFWALLLIAIAVSADAFAVAVGKGLAMRRLDLRHALVIAATFGGFQAAMPLIGWLLGSGLADYITEVDHWVAFGLLLAVGLKMLHEALTGEDDEDAGPALSGLLVLAVATSIDALAVGIGLALIDVQIALAVVLIGVTTFALSFAGVVLGHRVGARFRTPAEIAGGLILIGIGTRILLDHTGVL